MGKHGEDNNVGMQGEDDIAGVHGEEDGAAEPRLRGHARRGRRCGRDKEEEQRQCPGLASPDDGTLGSWGSSVRRVR